MRPGNTLRIILPVAALVGVAAVAGESPPDTPFAEGKAYDRQSGELLYREQHHCGASYRQCTVQYRDSTGTLIASKELDYRESATSPALMMRDFRNDREFRIPPGKEEVVVDAGFDNFVRDQWNVLAAGEPVAFRFQVAGFDSPLHMNITRSETAACASDELCLEVNSHSWLVRAFFEPIELSYSRDERKLLRYSGLSNIRDERGEAMDVDIFYEYGDTALAPRSAQGFLFQF